jgi:hypothetical protein
MADGSNYRSRRGSEYRRTDAGQGDPLAELARLIGQNDPFSDFARSEPVRPSSYGQESVPAWSTPRYQPPLTPPAYPEPSYPEPAYRDPAPHYEEQRYDERYPAQDAYADSRRGGDYPADAGRYGGPPYDDRAGAAYDDPNRHEAYADGSAHGAATQGYETDPYYRYDTLPRDEDIYERPRADKRGGLVTVVAVLALAVVGTAGAFAYRTVFSKSGAPLSPPVIKADPGPNKVVPAGEQQSVKVIRDRVGEAGQAERIVPREEQPVDVRNAPMRTILPGAPNPVTGLPSSASPATMPPGVGAAFPPPASQSGAAFTAPAASAPAAPVPVAASVGTSSTEPKKIKTIPIRPDRTDSADAPAARPSAQARTASAEQATPARTRTKAADGNAPLSLSPAASRSAASATRTAAVAPAAAPAAVQDSGGEGTYVQVTSQRSEADARSSWRSLQTQYPSLLGSRQAAIRRADLGSKGVYYRALVGPFASASEAGDLCNSLKSAGGQCVIQRN